jgi:hypothetical protein
MYSRLTIRESLTWRLTFQWVVGLLATLLLALLTYSRDGWVPLLSYFDLGIHELGHMLTFWAPELLLQLAGSILQVAVPLGFAAYFFRRNDRLAVVITLAWAAESLNNVSVYIYDATRMVLPLLGDDGSGAAHDWHNILGSLGLLEYTDAIAYTARGLSGQFFAAAIVLSIVWWAEARRRASFDLGSTFRGRLPAI